MALELITGLDAFEIVRDKIASILVAEIANQQALATAEDEDPNLWKIRVYTERGNSWEQFLDDQPTDTSPLVNIWFDSMDAVDSSSNPVSRQVYDGTYNLDVYAYGYSRDDGTGHITGDSDAVFTAHRAARIIRNIIMAGENTYLGLRGTVGTRVINQIQVFQPNYDAQSMQQVAGARLTLRVKFLDTSPQVSGELIETIQAVCYRSGTGEIIFRGTYEEEEA